MNGAQALLQTLAAHGVDTIFGYPGGCIMPFYDALPETSLRHILCRHEQGAALAADGYARARGTLGVCVATSGPGATNLVTGVANAMMDSVPLLVITGQVTRSLIGTDAFQETDVLGLSFGITKHSYLVTEPENLVATLCEALEIATSGRPGPVWLDIPKDVLLAELPALSELPRPLPNAEQSAAPGPAALRDVAERLSAARRPLLFSGGGVGAGGATKALRGLAERLGIPHVCSLRGIGNLGRDAPLDFGMLGMHGSAAANQAVAECDLLLALGVRFDDRATGALASFAAAAEVIHIDIDAAELNKNKSGVLGVRAELGKALTHLHRLLPKALAIEPWRARCRLLKRSQGFTAPAAPEGICGQRFLRALDHALPPATTVTCDVGQHQMWVAQTLRFAEPHHHLSSGGLGTMGFGLPAAIGAQLANPGATVVNVTGDGSVMMNLQELATLKRYGLPVKIIVLNNAHLGMVRQQQELFYAGRLSEVELSDNPDFAALAAAFGLAARTLEQPLATSAAITWLLAANGPALLQVNIDAQANVWPIVPPGAANNAALDAPGRPA